MSKKRGSLFHIFKACEYSFNGIKSAFQSEVAFRQDITICIILFVLTIFLPITLTHKTLMIMSLFTIILAELINTAIETVVDRISTEIHPLSKKAKDIGSALVFLSFLQMIIVFLTGFYLAIF